MTDKPRLVTGWLRQGPRSVFELLVATYENWRSDRAIRMGAALAYYGVFALVPLLASATAIAGLVFSEAEIQSFIIESLEAVVSDLPDDVRSVADKLAATVDKPSTMGGLTAISVLSGVLAASLMFVALQDSLNMIWKIPVQRGFRHSIRRRLIAFAIVLLTGAALVASLAVQAVALLIDEVLGGSIEALGAFNDLLVAVTTLAVGIGALALLLQLLIRDHLAWRNVLIAATATGVLLVVGTWATGFYFSNWGSASLTGVSGGVLVVLLWLYYLAQIMIAGAELLKTLEERSQTAGTG